jgi:hypothetical protein
MCNSSVGEVVQNGVNGYLFNDSTELLYLLRVCITGSLLTLGYTI